MRKQLCRSLKSCSQKDPLLRSHNLQSATRIGAEMRTYSGRNRGIARGRIQCEGSACKGRLDITGSGSLCYQSLLALPGTLQTRPGWVTPLARFAKMMKLLRLRLDAYIEVTRGLP